LEFVLRSFDSGFCLAYHDFPATHETWPSLAVSEFLLSKCQFCFTHIDSIQKKLPGRLLESADRTFSAECPLQKTPRLPLGALDDIFPLINQDDAEQVALYTQLQSDRDLVTSRDKLITLLFLLVKCFSPSSMKLHELVSYLQSHVALLQAPTCDRELASLFFIEQHGRQSFKSIPESVLTEQARRTGQCIKTLSADRTASTFLMDYESH
jgi:hypothetical protein